MHISKYCEKTNVLHRQLIIEGSFGNKNIRTEIYCLPENNKKVVINFHGLFGTNNNKYRLFAQRLQESEACNVILCETSRNKHLGEGADAFYGKSFQDELEDAKRVVQYCINNSQSLFGIPPNALEITLNGNSLGGVLAIMLSQEFEQVKHISTIGTGLRLQKPGNIPILSSHPSAETIKEHASMFRGKLIMNCGTHDSLFSIEAFQELFQSAINAEKQMVIFDEVDHSFTKLCDRKSEKPYFHIFQNVRELVSGVLVSGNCSFE